MAVQVLLAKTAGAGASSTVTCDGNAHIVIGMRALDSSNKEIAIGQYVGCEIVQEDGSGTDVGRPRDECGRPVILTTPRPMVAIRDAGTYRVIKGVTINDVEIWADDGT